jgi:hypothetical protein
MLWPPAGGSTALALPARRGATRQCSLALWWQNGLVANSVGILCGWRAFSLVACFCATLEGLLYKLGWGWGMRTRLTATGYTHNRDIPPHSSSFFFSFSFSFLTVLCLSVCLSSVPASSSCPPDFLFLQDRLVPGPDGYTSRQFTTSILILILIPIFTHPYYHGIARKFLVIIVAADAPGPEEPVPERAGTVHLRVAEPRWYLPILEHGHSFIMCIVRGSGRRSG